MASHDYHLVSNWRILGSPEELFEIIADQERLSSWWPSTFRQVLELDPGAQNGIGRILRMETRGWLPYMLRWHLRVEDYQPPRSLRFSVWGDFEGEGAWSLQEDGVWTNVTFDWQIAVRKGFVRHLSFLGRPLFVANHRWSMAQGEKSLHIEASRRRNTDPEDAEAIPPPPGPATYSGKALASAALAAGSLVVLRRRGGRKAI